MTTDQVPDDAAERFAELAWGGNPPILPAVLDRAKRYIALAHNVMSTNPKPEPTEETHVLARFAAGVDATGEYLITGADGLADEWILEDATSWLDKDEPHKAVLGTVWLPRVQPEPEPEVEGRVDE